MEWECWCDSGWFGEGCDVYMEKDCSDKKDNDDGERTIAFPRKVSLS